MARNSLGHYEPEPGDSLQHALKMMALYTGGLIAASSVGAARTLGTVIAQDRAISAADPVHFDVGGIAYRHDGAQLTPLNQMEYEEVSYSAANPQHTVGYGAFSGMMLSKLPIRQYDRAVLVISQAWASTVSGNLYHTLRTQGKITHARWPSGASTVTVFGMARIPAGVKPVIESGVQGADPSGGTVRLSASESLNHMAVLAFPVAMTA